METLVEQVSHAVEEIRQRAEEDVVAVDGTLLETPQKEAKQKVVDVARQKLSEANAKRVAARKMAFA